MPFGKEDKALKSVWM